jgi:ABC-type hemin transport system ATPase subunit
VIEPAPPGIQGSDLVTSYGQIEAARGPGLEVKPGTFGFLGPNGAVKSTIIKIAHSGQRGGGDRPGAAWPGERAVPKDGVTKQTFAAKPSHSWQNIKLRS